MSSDRNGMWLDGRVVLRLAMVAVALPFLASFAALVAAGGDGPRNHDVALIELRSSDVLGGDLPLVGSYERYGGNQPGPWLFYLLAVPSLAGGIGLGVAALLVGYGALCGMLWVARRRGGSILVLWTALLSILMALGRGFDRLTDPWEPMISLFVLALLVMLVWEVASGTWGALPWAVPVGWFLASIWLMLTPAVAMLGAVLVVAVGVRAWSTFRGGEPDEKRRAWWAFGISVAVLAVMVAPTVIEQLTATTGNLSALRSTAASSDPTVGLSGGWRALRLQFDLWAPWSGRSLPLTFSSEVDGSNASAVPIALVAWVAAMVGSVVVDHRRRPPTSGPDGVGPSAGVSEAGDAAAGDAVPVLGDPRPLWWLHAGVAAAFVGLLVGLSLSRGGVAVWSMQPTAALAMLLWLAAGWSVARLVLRHRPRVWCARTAAALAVVLAVVVVVATVAAVRGDQGADRLPAAVAELADAAARRVPVGAGPVLVSSDAEVDEVFESGDFGVAELVASLERDGYSTVVESDLGRKFGARRARPDEATAELRIESGDDVPDGPGWSLVRQVDPLTVGERRRRDRLDAEIESASGGARGADLLRMAADDPRLAALVRESYSSPSEPRLSLWYRVGP